MAREPEQVLRVGDEMRISVELIEEWKRAPFERSPRCRVVRIDTDEVGKVIWMERVDEHETGGGR